MRTTLAALCLSLLALFSGPGEAQKASAKPKAAKALAGWSDITWGMTSAAEAASHGRGGGASLLAGSSTI